MIKNLHKPLIKLDNHVLVLLVKLLFLHTQKLVGTAALLHVLQEVVNDFAFGFRWRWGDIVLAEAPRRIRSRFFLLFFAHLLVMVN